MTTVSRLSAKSSALVVNPEDRFSRDAANVVFDREKQDGPVLIKIKMSVRKCVFRILIR